MSQGIRTILVVDDEAPQRDLIRGILQTGSYRVLEASDYDAAIAVQKQHPGQVDLALIDLRLPGRDGHDLSRTLLASEPGIRVVFISGSAGAELCKFFDMPITDVQFLQKPFGSAELLQRVKLVLEAGPLAGNAVAC